MVAVAVRGHRAIETVRKLIGHTIPLNAAPGTIRGDHSNDAPEQANAENRPVHNLIHASGNSTEATRELNLWFPDTPADSIAHSAIVER
jgi:nucleoside-diphosphate kinase